MRLLPASSLVFFLLFVDLINPNNFVVVALLISVLRCFIIETVFFGRLKANSDLPVIKLSCLLFFHLLLIFVLGLRAGI